MWSKRDLGKGGREGGARVWKEEIEHALRLGNTKPIEAGLGLGTLGRSPGRYLGRYLDIYVGTWVLKKYLGIW